MSKTLVERELNCNQISIIIELTSYIESVLMNTNNIYAMTEFLENVSLVLNA